MTDQLKWTARTGLSHLLLFVASRALSNYFEWTLKKPGGRIFGTYLTGNNVYLLGVKNKLKNFFIVRQMIVNTPLLFKGSEGPPHMPACYYSCSLSLFSYKNQRLRRG